MQNAQMQKENQRRDAFYSAIQNATPDQLPALRRQYPEFAQTIQQEIGIQSAEHASFVNGALNNLSVAAATGNPSAVQAAIQQSGPALASLGVTSDQVMQLFQQDPDRFSGILNAARLATLPIDKQFDIESDRAKLAETIRSNRAGEAIQIRAQNISSQNAALSREIQRAEMQDKVLDRQIARETNQLRLEELKQKQIDVQNKAASARADRQAAAQGAVDTFTTALDSLGEIESSPGLGKAVGFNSAFPTIPGTDAANFEARLDTFKAQTFLPMVQSLKGMGALSDAEGKKLSDAVGALNPKMSEKAFRDSISKIRTQLESKLGTVKRQFNYQEPAPSVQQQPTQQTTGYSSLWGD
ncbi:acyltransferase [Atlantibacter subterranea]|uniref:Acyltransferase n=2 Tax=Atlantibacter subterraneus TaxID=255519 RepID=A0A427UR55_9ENTR|nr:acyltransferase [Atlantibacter subterranea]RSE02501.1 acyltransferase [Atlantibacter subterranea]RSE23012.1 acyltransferase [Atlantibacter subterranea]